MPFRTVISVGYSGHRHDGVQRRPRMDGASVASGLIFRVEAFEFCPGVVGSELPIDSGLLAVTFVLPSGGLVDQRLFVGKPHEEGQPKGTDGDGLTLSV